MISSKPLPLKVSHSSAPCPYRFVSNTTGWWTEYNSSKHTCYLCMRLFFILLNKQRLPHPTMLFRPVFYSCTNKATHFKELAKTTSFSFFLKDQKYHEYRFTERYNKKTQEAAFPTGLGEIPLWDGQTWPQTQHGEVLNSPGQLLQLWLIRSVSEGWVTTGQAQRAQTKNLQAFHKGSGHNKSKTEKTASFLVSILHFGSTCSLEETC